jgi:hypothetical protein
MLVYTDGSESDDTALEPVAVWCADEPGRKRTLPIAASRLLWAGKAPNGDALVAVSDEHGISLWHLPSGEKIWGTPLPALVTSLYALPNFDLAVGTQQGIVLIRPKIPKSWGRIGLA